MPDEQAEQEVAEAAVSESDVALYALLTMMNYQAIERGGTPVPLLNPLPSAYMKYSHN